MTNSKTTEYSTQNMRELTGLDPIRMNPSQYIGSIAPISAVHGSGNEQDGELLEANGFHLFVEILGNSSDEATNGYATRINIDLFPDESIRITDNGRGIPPDRPTLPDGTLGPSGVSLAVLHMNAGGKFGAGDKNNKHRAYAKGAQGLHGVGAACVCALSDRFDVTVWRNGKAYSLSAKRGVQGVFAGDKISSKFTQTPDADVSESDDNRPASVKAVFPHGTCVHWHPDPIIFSGGPNGPVIPWYDVIQYVKAQSYMAPECTYVINDYTKLGGSDGKTPVTTEYHHPGGINDMIDEKTAKTKNVSPIVSFDVPTSYMKTVTTENDDGSMSKSDVSYDCDVKVALRWTTKSGADIEGYANGVHCVGKHVDGFRRGITRGVNEWIKKSNLMTKKDEKDGITPNVDDMTDGMIAVIEVLLEDQCDFQGQTKDALSNPEVLSCVSDVVKEQVTNWLSARKNAKAAKAIGKSVLDNARLRNRQKKEREAVKKAKDKLGGFSSKPAKLVDCRNEGKGTELIICEGDSAAGSIKIARDANMQALMPVRGVSLNAYGQSEAKILSNQEFADLTVAMGGGGIRDKFDLNKRRYERISIYTDADPDGAYIRSLLLVFIYYCFPGMIEGGHVFAGCPPLYSIKVVKGPDKGKRYFAADEKERDVIINKFMANGGDLKNLEIARSKGLGEMSPLDEFKPCLDPATRKVRVITLNDVSEARDMADDTFRLMFSRKQDAKDERREWIDNTFESVDE